MTQIKDGGPAFPEAIAVGPTGNVYPGYSGMTLRDWFAGQALAGYVGILSTANEQSLTKIAIENSLTGYVTNGQIAASVAYGFADAMLAAREERQP